MNNRLKQLEEIVAELESGDLSLEAAIKKFEEGMELSRFCSQKLEETERRVTILMKDSWRKRRRETLRASRGRGQPRLTMFDLPAYLERNNARIDQALDGFLPPVTRAGRLAEAMRYSVMAGGKRLRPNLCLAAAEAVGGDSGDAMAAACALEMIHTYSLIHDDLPAMDNDRLRRGRPTCHIAFDEATAILAGDALLTLAFEIVAVHSPGPVERRTEVVRLLASAAGPAGMVGGQMLDMLSEGRALDQTELEGLHRLKTGALIEASLACGAVLAGGSGAQIGYPARIRASARAGVPGHRRHSERGGRPFGDGQGRRDRPSGATRAAIPESSGL